VEYVEFYLSSLHTSSHHVRRIVALAINRLLRLCRQPLQLRLDHTTFNKDEFAVLISNGEHGEKIEVSKLELIEPEGIQADAFDFLMSSVAKNLRILHINHTNERENLNLVKFIPDLGNLFELQLMRNFTKVLDLFQTLQEGLLPTVESFHFGNDYSLTHVLSDASLSGFLKFRTLKRLTTSLLLAESLDFSQSSLELLDVTLHVGTTPQAIIKLLESLKLLKHLRISFPKGQSEMSELISYLVGEQREQNLESLALQTKTFEDDAFHRLCSYLLLNTSLTNTTLEGISDSDEAVAWLSEVIEKNTSLEKLVVQQTTWTVKSIVRIIEALCVNKSLITVKFGFANHQIDQGDRMSITRKLNSCLDANRGITQLSSPLISLDEGQFMEGATIPQKLQRNAEEFSKQVRFHSVRAMMKVSANKLPKDVMKVILQLSSQP
jgi:hypothetical protein